jgi:hypothetical protein
MTKNRLNSEEKLMFYKSRRRKGDVERLATATGYTQRMIYYVLRGERNVNNTIASAMYNLSRRRATVTA